MISEAEAMIEAAPLRADWIVDGMAAVRSVPPKKTWEEYAENLLKFCMPSKKFNPAKLVIVMDTYGPSRIKEMTQRGRGCEGRKIFITEKGQSMPQGKDWMTFLLSGHNKMELIKFLANYYRSEQVRSNLEIPLVFTESSRTWMITPNGVQLLEDCNHHEADTRIIRHASLSQGPVVVVAADTDVFVLLVFANRKISPAETWSMKIGKDSFVDIGRVCEVYGDVCDTLPAFHSVTGCDTTSYPYMVGKIKPLKRLVEKQKSYLLHSFGVPPRSFRAEGDVLSLMQLVLYPGRDGEDYVQTRIRMYEQQKTKSSLSLLPDKHSAEQHLKRANLQTYLWMQCLQKDIDYPSIDDDTGWKETDDGLVPVWYSCSQFPPSLTRRPPRRQRHGYEPGDETSGTDSERRQRQPQPPRKRQRRMCNDNDTSDDESSSSTESEEHESDLPTQSDESESDYSDLE